MTWFGLNQSNFLISKKVFTWNFLHEDSLIDYVDGVRRLRTAATNGPIFHPLMLYVSVESHGGDDAGWGKLLTRP
jgi:hypothetical protein